MNQTENYEDYDIDDDKLFSNVSNSRKNRNTKYKLDFL